MIRSEEETRSPPFFQPNPIPAETGLMTGLARFNGPVA